MMALGHGKTDPDSTWKILHLNLIKKLENSEKKQGLDQILDDLDNKGKPIVDSTGVAIKFNIWHMQIVMDTPFFSSSDLDTNHGQCSFCQHYLTVKMLVGSNDGEVTWKCTDKFTSTPAPVVSGTTYKSINDRNLLDPSQLKSQFDQPSVMRKRQQQPKTS
jgi:hypothetical protein